MSSRTPTKITRWRHCGTPSHWASSTRASTTYPHDLSSAKMSLKYPLAVPFTSPDTFSATNARGRTPRRSRAYSKNKSSDTCLLPSAWLDETPHPFSRLPAVEKLWHGGDPSKRSSSPALSLHALSMSCGRTFRMSRGSRYVKGWFGEYESRASDTNSFAYRTRYPAIRYPRHEPPHPENVEATVSPFGLIAAISDIDGTR